MSSMSREELYGNIMQSKFNGLISIWSVKKLMDEFFKDKVIIQRGENRHPYADVLHAHAEGETIQVKTSPKNEWETIKNPNWGYRIKPSEPVYEYKWCLLCVNDFKLSEWYTEEEFNRTTLHGYMIVETKRERK